MNDLIFCTGFKGGIGKSFMTAAVVDYLSSKNDNIVCDSFNGDTKR